MIYFVLSKNNSGTIREYLLRRGKPISAHIGIILYSSFSKILQKEISTLIFSDYDRLTPDQMILIGDIQAQIAKRYPALPMINRIQKYKQRFPLLRECFESGLNPYNVHRVYDDRKAIQFPIFLRHENEHLGPLTPLIYSEKDLDAYILSMKILGMEISSLLIVEFFDVSDRHGIYNKYSATILGDTIIPRYLDFSRKWIVKADMTDLPLAWKLDRFQKFIEENPHLTWQRSVFEKAGVEYGRMDYAVKDGRPVLWEINLNPSFGRGPINSEVHPELEKIRRTFHQKLHDVYLNYAQLQNFKIQLDIQDNIDNLLKNPLKSNLQRKVQKFLSTERAGYRNFANICRKLALASAKTWIAVSPRNGTIKGI